LNQAIIGGWIILDMLVGWAELNAAQLNWDKTIGLHEIYQIYENTIIMKSIYQ